MAFYRFFRWALEGEVLEVYGDGEQSRDFTHVNDIVEANWLASDKAPAGTVFNIGGGSRITLNGAIGIIGEITGRELEVNYQAKQKGDVRHTKADMTKAEEELGYKPKVAIREGLQAEYEWVRGLVK
jgi:nucleoside-diphosphate-sugar epimerase